METFESESQKIGLPPGTLVHVGRPRTAEVGISVIDYSADQIVECEAVSLDEIAKFKESDTVTWINVDGVHQVDVVRQIGTLFGIHPLVQEDIVNTGQRPKTADYGDYLFVVLKMLYWDKAASRIAAEQVSILITPQVVVSFQEQPGDVFDSVRERLRQGKGRIRTMGADYLAYSLLDAVVDNYFVMLEWVGERIDRIEEALISNPSQEIAHQIQALKKEMLTNRKAIWPMREMVGALRRGDCPLIQAETLPFLSDVYDHVVQVIDTAETYRDMASALRDTYLTVISNRMNEVMKVLTIIATIFIPLTFIAGVYGMNFEAMPELKWPWAYPAVMAVMAAVAVIMLLYFKRKKWL
jgi:magnesium transporter